MKRKTIVLFLLVALVAGCAANSYGIQATGVTGYGRDCKKSSGGKRCLPIY